MLFLFFLIKPAPLECYQSRVLLFEYRPVLSVNNPLPHQIVYDRRSELIHRRCTRNHHQANHPSHLPIRYLLEAPGRDLIYKARLSEKRGVLHYVFTRYDRYRRHEMPFPVPCMSTCGMMVDHELMTRVVSGWPEQLGIYGGGENFLNYTLALLGYNVMIFPHPAIEHYAERRGYHWNWLDYQRNRMIAVYLVGGHDWLDRFTEAICSDPRVNRNTMSRTRRQITTDVGLISRRAHYKELQAAPIEEWLNQWRDSPLAEFKDEDD